MYTNRTMSPPKKIKNKINENHLVFIKIQEDKHTNIVCAKIRLRIATGCDEDIKIKDTIIDILINIKISECSL